MGTHDIYMKAKEVAYNADVDPKYATRFGMQAYFHSAAANYWQSKVDLEKAESTGEHYGNVVRVLYVVAIVFCLLLFSPPCFVFLPFFLCFCVFCFVFFVRLCQ